MGILNPRKLIPSNFNLQLPWRFKYFKHSPGVSLPQSAVPTVPADTLKAVNQEVGKELEKECKRGST